jgi:hypothetical protein
MAPVTSFGASKRREAIRTAGAGPLKRGVKRGDSDDAPFQRRNRQIRSRRVDVLQW